METETLKRLTDGAASVTITSVPTLTPDISPALSTPESFGTWLKYVRQLSGLTQQVAAKKAGVSFDAVKRIERGQLIGSAHLLAWISWLAEFPDEAEVPNMGEEIARWPQKLIALGDYIRDHGLALKAPKSKSSTDKSAFDVTKEVTRIKHLEHKARPRKRK